MERNPADAHELPVPPDVSVIIPVFEDWERLSLCLRALLRQTLAPSRFELIVVNNGSVADEARELPAGVILLHEPAGYSYAARNAGIRRAHGRILAFTDADCIPADDWLSQGLQAMEDFEADVLGGRVDIQPGAGLAACYDRAFGLCQPYYLEHFGGMATANLLVRKAVAEAVDGFDGTLQSGGDLDFCRRASSRGFKLAYANDVVVAHPARAGVAEILAQNRRHTVGHVDISWHRRPAGRPARWRYLWRLWRPAWREWLAILRGRDLRVGKRPLVQRLGLCAMRCLIHYHRALVGMQAMHRSRAGFRTPA